MVETSDLDEFLALATERDDGVEVAGLGRRPDRDPQDVIGLIERPPIGDRALDLARGDVNRVDPVELEVVEMGRSSAALTHGRADRAKLSELAAETHPATPPCRSVGEIEMVGRLVRDGRRAGEADRVRRRRVRGREADHADGVEAERIWRDCHIGAGEQLLRARTAVVRRQPVLDRGILDREPVGDERAHPGDLRALGLYEVERRQTRGEDQADGRSMLTGGDHTGGVGHGRLDRRLRRFGERDGDDAAAPAQARQVVARADLIGADRDDGRADQQDLAVLESGEPDRRSLHDLWARSVVHNQVVAPQPHDEGPVGLDGVGFVDALLLDIGSGRTGDLSARGSGCLEDVAQPIRVEALNPVEAVGDRPSTVALPAPRRHQSEGTVAVRRQQLIAALCRLEIGLEGHGTRTAVRLRGPRAGPVPHHGTGHERADQRGRGGDRDQRPGDHPAAGSAGSRRAQDRVDGRSAGGQVVPEVFKVVHFRSSESSVRWCESARRASDRESRLLTVPTEMPSAVAVWAAVSCTK